MTKKQPSPFRFLDISKNEVKTTVSATVHLLTEEYRNISDNDMLSDEDFDSFTDGISSFKIPGTFEINFPEEGESAKIFLSYPVNLIKNAGVEVNSKEIIINYEPGDVIFNAYIKENETNISILDSLFENRVKYLRGHVPEQLFAIWEQLSSTVNYSSHHLQLILSLIYAKKVGKENILIRHTPDQNYTKDTAINTRQSSHAFNMGGQAFTYGYSNEALITSAVKNRSERYKQDENDISILDKPIDTRVIKSSPSTLGINLDIKQQELRKGMVNEYTDLENIMGGRYDDLIEKKKNYRDG